MHMGAVHLEGSGAEQKIDPSIHLHQCPFSPGDSCFTVYSENEGREEASSPGLYLRV
jgi:hypothetical protein